MDIHLNLHHNNALGGVLRIYKFNNDFLRCGADYKDFIFYNLR